MRACVAIPFQSVCARIDPVVQRAHALRASAIFRIIRTVTPQSEGGDEGKSWCIYLLLFPRPFAVRSVSPWKHQGDPLAVTLALTENSNVAQTLGAHLRRKRVAVTSSWMRDERVNQSLVAFSRRRTPRYTPIWETGRERGFYLIGRKFPPFRKSAIHARPFRWSGITTLTANPVSYFTKFQKKLNYSFIISNVDLH